MTKKAKTEIIVEIENFGECFLGTVDVHGPKVFKWYNAILKEYEKNHKDTLAYDAESGVIWAV